MVAVFVCNDNHFWSCYPLSVLHISCSWVVVDFGRLTTLDGTRVKLQVDETATEKNKSLELAAGASMAGILLLGSPVGLVGGYFVRGKDVKIEANVPFFVETERATSVSGFYFRPASL